MPEQVQEIFKDVKVISIGLQHGTVTVVFEDGDYKPGFENKDIGNILNKLLDMVMREEVRINKEDKAR